VLHDYVISFKIWLIRFDSDIKLFFLFSVSVSCFAGTGKPGSRTEPEYQNIS
jgi:hypothetical protein